MAIPFSQWKAQQGGGGSQPATKPGVIPYSQYKATKTPEAPSFGQALSSTAKSFIDPVSGPFAPEVGFAKGAVRQVQSLGQIGGSITDKLGLTKGAGSATFFQDPKALESQGFNQKAGDVFSYIAPYLTGVGEEEGAVLGAKTLAKTGSKVASAVASHIPSFASNVAIGTAQTKDIVSGVENAIGAEIGQYGLNKVGSYLATNRLNKVGSYLATRGAKLLTKALTPKLLPKEAGIEMDKAARLGEIYDPASVSRVKRSVDSITTMAKRLGVNISDIIKTDVIRVKEAGKNAARVGAAIADYSKNVVDPFIKKVGVNYNYADLSKYLRSINPPKGLSKEGITAFNDLREQIISTIGNHLDPNTTGGSSISQLIKMAGGKGEIPAKSALEDTKFWDTRKIIDDVGNKETKGQIFNSDKFKGTTASWKTLREGYKQYLSDAYRYPNQMENVIRANQALSTPQILGIAKQGTKIEDYEKQFNLVPSPESIANQAEWESHMSTLSGGYDAIKNLISQEKTQIGKSWASLFAKEHPLLTKGSAFVGSTGLAAFGVGEIIKHF